MRDAWHMNRQFENETALRARAEFAAAEADAARQCALKLARTAHRANTENARLRAVLAEIARRASRAQWRSHEAFSQLVLADVAARAIDAGQP